MITIIKTTVSETPLRSVLSNARGVTGYVTFVSCGPVTYEFPVERDFLERLEFNPRVKLVRSQPVQVEFLDESGMRRKYTADFYVEYHQHPDLPIWRPRLFEVKRADELRAEIEDLRPKLIAATMVCKERGWLFRVATERVIRSDQFTNVNFLRGFCHRDDPHGYVPVLLECLNLRGRMTAARLLDLVCSSVEERLGAVPQLWKLVATHQVRTDLRRPLNMDSPVWLVPDV